MQEPAVQEPTIEEPLAPPPQAAPAEPTPVAEPPPLRRDMSRRMIGGVCAGIARTYDYDVTVVRIVALLLTLPGGVGFVLYAVLWALMPADTGTPQPAHAMPTSNAEDIAERIRLAADEFAAATRAAAYATRVAAEQLSEVARMASAAGRESWDSRPSAQAAAAPPASPEAPPSPPAAPTAASAPAPAAPEAPEAPNAPSAPSAPGSTPPA